MREKSHTCNPETICIEGILWKWGKIQDDVVAGNDTQRGVGAVDAGFVFGNGIVVYAEIWFFSGARIWRVVEKYCRCVVET